MKRDDSGCSMAADGCGAAKEAGMKSGQRVRAFTTRCRRPATRKLRTSRLTKGPICGDKTPDDGANTDSHPFNHPRRSTNFRVEIPGWLIEQTVSDATKVGYSIRQIECDLRALHRKVRRLERNVRY